MADFHAVIVQASLRPVPSLWSSICSNRLPLTSASRHRGKFEIVRNQFNDGISGRIGRHP